MVSELLLLNVVIVPTHKDNDILYLVLTNDIDMISGLKVEENEKFSDYKLIICDLDICYDEVKSDCDKVMNNGNNLSKNETSTPFLISSLSCNINLL